MLEASPTGSQVVFRIRMELLVGTGQTEGAETEGAEET